MTSFCLKFQPQGFDDFCMDPSLKCMLNTLMSMDHLNVLFVGDVGVGKTTYIQALIRTYYKDVPPSQYHSNVTHINSLKEQGMHFYRTDVKTFCQTCSSVPNKKKIVVLDDLDLIHEQNQQIFRNYIDKYSHNVHFIASCLNPQKVLNTIQSRFTLVKLSAPTKEQLRQKATDVIRTERLHIDDDALHQLVNMSSNMKQLLKHLEKVYIYCNCSSPPLPLSSSLSSLPLMDTEETKETDTIDTAIMNQVCTNISFEVFEQYTSMLLQGRLLDAMTLILSVYDTNGFSVIDILDNYFVFVKHTTMLSDTQKYDCIPVICKYIAVFFEIHEDEIELSFMTNKLCQVLFHE